MANEIDKRKREMQEMIRAKQMKSEDPATGGASQPAEAAAMLMPMTFRDKWKNYWYHYKWHTIVVVAVVCMAISLIWSINSKTKYDATVTIVSAFPFSGLSDSIEKELSEFSADNTGNGKTELLITGFQIADDETEDSIDPEIYSGTMYKLNVWPTTYEYYVYLLDEAGYKIMTDIGLAFMDLSGVSSDPNVQGDKYRLAGTKLEQKLYAEDMDMFLCFCDYSSYPDSLKNKDSVRKSYENDWQLFMNMLAYH